MLNEREIPHKLLEPQVIWKCFISSWVCKVSILSFNITWLKTFKVLRIQKFKKFLKNPEILSIANILMILIVNNISIFKLQMTKKKHMLEKQKKFKLCTYLPASSSDEFL